MLNKFKYGVEEGTWFCQSKKKCDFCTRFSQKIHRWLPDFEEKQNNNNQQSV